MKFDDRLTELQEELRPLFLRLTRDDFLTEEILQFALVQCWRHWPEKDHIEQRRLTMTAGRRFYFNLREKEKNQKNRLARMRTLRQPESSPDSPLQAKELEHKVRQGLRRLPFLWSEVLERAFYGDQDNATIAKAMERPVSTIKNWKRRAINRLRSTLDWE